MAFAPPSSFSESDLHGLVDGYLEPGRQADLLQRLKSHAPERARVASWKEQNDLLKASFSEVEHEAIPLSLTLTPPPRLKCVTSEGWSGNATAPMAITPLLQLSAKRSRRGVVALGALIGCVGLIGCWLATEHAASIEPTPLVLAATGAADGLLVTPSFETSTLRNVNDGSVGSGQPRRPPRNLPTATIPDLADTGFTFTGATVRGAEAPALDFSYEDAAMNHLVLSVSKSDGRVDAAAADHVVSWRHHGTVYTLGGTPDQRRLNTIAQVLQAAERAADDD